MKRLLQLWLLTLVSLAAAENYSGVLDSAVYWGNSKVYFFKGGEYIRFNYSFQATDRGYPKNLNTSTWPGLSFETIDALFDYGDGNVYIFSGNQYMGYDKKKDQANPGYPRIINNATWPGMPFTSIDAAFNAGTGKAYFFKGNQYIRFDLEKGQTDPGYPREINQKTWPGLPFTTIDAVFYIKGKAFFFSGEEYARFDIASDRTDTGYPRNTMEYWKGVRFETVDSAASAMNNITIAPPGTLPVTDGTETEAEKVSRFKVETFKVDFAPYPLHLENTVLGWVMLAPFKDGRIAAGYQIKSDLYLHFLNSRFQRTGTPVILKNYWLSDLHPLPDGSLILLLGRDEKNTYIHGYPNTLYIMKLDTRGKQQFRTYIFGGTGHGPGKSWFDGRSKAKLAYNGTNFGVYFEVQKNWADPGEKEDIHNGDMFVEISPKGELQEETRHFWTASHSSTIQVAGGLDKKFYTMTIGDAYPYGLQFYDRKEDKSWILWPPEEDYIPYEEVNSTNAAGILEVMIPAEEDFIALMGTLEHPNIGVFDKVDVMFLRTDTKGQVKTRKWLCKTPGEDESVITAAPGGGGFILGWGTGNDYNNNWEPGPITLSVVDKEGDFILPPQKTGYPLGTYSRFYSGAGGEIYWPLADNGSSEVTIYRLTLE